MLLQIMVAQQSGIAEDCMLIKMYINSKFLEPESLLMNFLMKIGMSRCLNRFFKKLQDFDEKKQIGSIQHFTVHFDSLLVFARYDVNI